MRVRLYWFPLSNPGQAVRLMLELKGIEYEARSLVPGLHRAQVRLAGFRGGRVPAMKIDGRRVEGSLAISRALEELRPEPSLFPEPRRAAVEQAEHWGESVLQPVTGRVFHWALVHDVELREWLARVSRVPAAGVLARVTGPLARFFASDAPDDAVRADLEALPGMLDHVESLLADGTIGAAEQTAADFQIATTVRELVSFADLREYVLRRPAGEWAMRVLPEWDDSPVRLPAEWLPAPCPAVQARA
jgi:glutathione S-transferase